MSALQGLFARDFEERPARMKVPGSEPAGMATPNVLFGVVCVAAFAGGALLARLAWPDHLSPYAAKLLAGLGLGVGLAAAAG